MRLKAAMLAASAFLIAFPALAGWTEMPAGKPVAVAKSTMTVTPGQNWNRWSARPSQKGELWTIDGLSLNELSFFAAVSSGEPLYRELNKKDQPLPKFKSGMLPTDLVEFFEASNRIVLQSPLFTIDKVEPTKLSGNDAVRFSYHYAVEGDQLNRKGEGVAANINGKLYLVNFVAPEIHYYDRDIASFRDMVAKIKI
jgi:hypothetical protein